MSVLTDLAELIVQQKKITPKFDSRLGWLENEIALLKAKMDIPTVEDGISDNEIDLAKRNRKRRPGNGTVMPVGCQNNGGQDQLKAPIDHIHMGVKHIYATDCESGKTGRFVGGLALTPGAAMRIKVETADAAEGWPPDGPGLMAGAITDDNDTNPDGTTDGGGAAPGDYNPTYCEAEITIGHPPINNATFGACTPDVDCVEEASVNVMTTPTCSAITFAGAPFEVDCAGHLHSVTEHTLVLPSTVTFDDSSLACCTTVSVLTDFTFSCGETTSDGKKTFALTASAHRKSFKLPKDTWNVASASEGSTFLFVNDITVVEDSDCPCGFIISVHKKVLNGLSVSFDVLCSATLSGSTFTTQKRTLVFQYGILTNSGSCA